MPAGGGGAGGGGCCGGSEGRRRDCVGGGCDCGGCCGCCCLRGCLRADCCCDCGRGRAGDGVPPRAADGVRTDGALLPGPRDGGGDAGRLARCRPCCCCGGGGNDCLAAVTATADAFCLDGVVVATCCLALAPAAAAAAEASGNATGRGAGICGVGGASRAARYDSSRLTASAATAAIRSFGRRAGGIVVVRRCSLFFHQPSLVHLLSPVGVANAGGCQRVACNLCCCNQHPPPLAVPVPSSLPPIPTQSSGSHTTGHRFPCDGRLRASGHKHRELLSRARSIAPSIQ